MDERSVTIFISWSGARSRQVADALHPWLSDIFDNITPWMSDRDIAAGGRSLDEIHEALSSAAFGIVVVTPENQGSTWVSYEAGAVSRALGSAAKVVPLLVSMRSPAQLTGPLAQFQALLADREGVWRLVRTLAAVASVPEGTARRRFDVFWPRLAVALQDVDVGPARGVERTERELLEEMLERLRAVVRPQLQVPPHLVEHMERVAEQLERPPTEIELRDRNYLRQFGDLATEVRQLAVSIESLYWSGLVAEE